MDVQIVLPAVSNDAISDWLVALTEQVCKKTGGTGTYGLLGGAYGYGEDFENEVFMLHRYCWCEQPDCPWCKSCCCGDDWETNPCINCRNPDDRAPNFLHNPTGATVHWYKYIGRGMEVSKADWPAIFRECFASLTPNAGGARG